MNAIVTIDYKLPVWSVITLLRMQGYADRIGAKIHIAKPEVYRSFLDRGPIFQGALKRYDRVALIDADCVISREAPDIFAQHPAGKVWMVPDCDGNGNPRWPPQMKIMQEVLGDIGWTKGYGNFGVTLVEPCHIEAFQEWREIPDVNHDQTNFNYRIRKLGYDLGWLDRRWNSMAITVGLPDHPSSCPEMAKDAWIAHTAGFTEDIRSTAITELDRLMP